MRLSFSPSRFCTDLARRRDLGGAANAAFDASGLHGIGILFIVPAFLIALSGRWLPLPSVSSVLQPCYLSVLVAGQISN